MKTGCCERTPTPFSSQQAGGTHPTGILSCVYKIFRCLDYDLTFNHSENHGHFSAFIDLAQTMCGKQGTAG